MDKLGPVAKSLGLRVPPAAPQGLVGTPLRYCLSFAIQVYHTLRGPSSAATSPARVKVEWISSNKIVETRYSGCMYCAPCWGGQNSAFVNQIPLATLDKAIDSKEPILPFVKSSFWVDPEHQLQHMLQLLFLILSHRRKTQWCSKSVLNVCPLPIALCPLSIVQFHEFHNLSAQMVPSRTSTSKSCPIKLLT